MQSYVQNVQSIEGCKVKKKSSKIFSHLLLEFAPIRQLLLPFSFVCFQNFSMLINYSLKNTHSQMSLCLNYQSIFFTLQYIHIDFKEFKCAF